MRGVRVKCQVWKGCGWPPWSRHAHICGRREAEEGFFADFSASYYPLHFSSHPYSLTLSFSLSLPSWRSPSFTLSIFHPLHPNYWCHSKLDCYNWMAAFPLKSPNSLPTQWKQGLFPSANFQVCVMGGKEENAGWLPPLLWNVFTKGWERLWSFGSSPLYFKHSPLLFLSVSTSQTHFLFISFLCSCSEFLL